MKSWGRTRVEFELIKALSAFPDTVKDAADKYEPSYIARYAVDVSQKFNKFYFDCKILSAEDEPTKKFRLALTAATLQTLKNAFALLASAFPRKCEEGSIWPPIDRFSAIFMSFSLVAGVPEDVFAGTPFVFTNFFKNF